MTCLTKLSAYAAISFAVLVDQSIQYAITVLSIVLALS